MLRTTHDGRLPRTRPSSSPPRCPPVLALALAFAALLTACTSSASRPLIETPSSSSTYRGDALAPTVNLSGPDLSDVFQASTGGHTTLAGLQRGHLMLLYFGYTHCPDVCPTTMADLGLALRRLPSVEQAHTQVVFVTSDPDRDSAAVMKSWLSNFDTSLPVPFVGLTAKIGQIDAVAKSVGIPLKPPVKHANGTITVEHGAQTLAFVGGRAHVLWTAGTSPADYAHDVGVLLRRFETG